MPVPSSRNAWQGWVVLLATLFYIALICGLLQYWQRLWQGYREAPYQLLLVAEQPRFSEIESTTQKKAVFLSYIGTLVTNENRRLLLLRRKVEVLRQKHARNRAFTQAEFRFIADLVSEYKLDPADMDARRQFIPAEVFVRLHLAVAPVPILLAQAQAAIESGWGSSRFAVQANNVYGQRCFDAGCGLVPANRPDGQQYEVKAFAKVSASVASYIKNLNSNTAYADFRDARAEQLLLKSKHSPRFSVAEALALVEHLQAYSTRRQDYIRQVQAMISAIAGDTSNTPAKLLSPSPSPSPN